MGTKSVDCRYPESYTKKFVLSLISNLSNPKLFLAYFALLIPFSLTTVNAQAQDISGGWVSSGPEGQKTVELSKTGSFTITLQDISDAPEELKFKDIVQTGSWRLASNTSGSHLGSFGKQNRLYFKFSTAQGDKIQGYKFRLFTLDGAQAIELVGPGLLSSLGDELGIAPKEQLGASLAERAGGYYIRP